MTDSLFTYEVHDAAFGGAIYTSPTLTLPAGGSVTDSGWAPASLASPYGLQITFPDSFNKVVVVQFNITDSTGSTIFENKLDVLRDAYTARVIYQHTDNTPIVLTHTIDGVASWFNLYRLSSLTSLAFSRTTDLIPSSEYTDADAGSGFNDQRTYNTLTAGYYVLEILESSTPAATITYQTDVYDCPSYLTNMTDYNRIFEGCIDRTNYFTASIPYINTHPVFSLPSIVAKEVLEIQLDFINPNTAGTPNTFYIEILDSAGAALTNQPAPFGTTTALMMTPVGTPYKTFWTAPLAGNFYLRITRPTGTEDSLQVYYLTVYRPNDASKIVTAVDVLR